MAIFGNPPFSPKEFSGKVRLFPLPNLVLFPHVMQPLHVFEQRYRMLLEDALAGDRLIAMAALAPGWENDYEGRPTLYPMACLGRVAAQCRLPDGTYNMLVLGVQRVRLLRELTPGRLFREAEAQLCEDDFSTIVATQEHTLRRQLIKSLLRVLPILPEAQVQLDQLLESDIPLGVLTDVIGYMIDIDQSSKQLLLGEVDVRRRAELLLHFLAELSADLAARVATVSFAPEFSNN
jgi:uncharacterized protein